MAYINSSKKEASVIRDSVNEKQKYCRIPIRRKRTPILAEEFQAMLEYQLSNVLTAQDMKERVISLDSEQRYEEAGKIITYLDFMKIIEIEPAVEME